MKKSAVLFLIFIFSVFFAAWLGRLGQAMDQYWIEIAGLFVAIGSIVALAMSVFWFSRSIGKVIDYIIKSRNR